MVQISRNPRKRKRFLENEFYAREARFWMGTGRHAKMMDAGVTAVNKQSLRGARTRPRGPKKKAKPTIVYAVKFTLISDPSLIFLKIGITGADVVKRFAADEGRYKVTVVKQVEVESRAYALALEGALHTIFRPHRFRPPAPLLSGGNSECFRYSEHLESEFNKVVYADVAQR